MGDQNNEKQELERYNRGFNHGYLLHGKNPELSEKLRYDLVTKNGSYEKGYVDGTRELEREQKLQKIIVTEREKRMRKDKSLGKDI